MRPTHTSGQVDLHAIRADRQGGDGVRAFLVADVDAREVGPGVGRADGRAGKNSAGVVGHDAFNARGRRLRNGGQRTQNEHYCEEQE